MNFMTYFYIGFFFSLFIKLVNDFAPQSKDMKSVEQDMSQDYSGKSYILLGLFWPFYIGLFILILIVNSLKKGNKTK